MRILLSRLDRIGDLVLSTPAIASVRGSWPRAHVTLVCSSYNAAVVERNRDVDEVVVLESGTTPAQMGARFRGACDIAIALAPCTPDFFLVGATRAPQRIGYTYRRRYIARVTARLFLTHLLISEADPELCERRPTYRVRHEVDQVLDLVARAGGAQLLHDLVVTTTADDRAAVAHVPSGGIVVHLAPRWLRNGSTLASFIALLNRLRSFGLPVVVTHGTDVGEAVPAVVCAGAADCIVGGMSFGQWAAVFGAARLIVTVDTGATHVASAMQRPTVVLFEHRYFNLNSQEWAPYHVAAALLRKPADESETALAASRESIVTAVESLLTYA
ncbi:MAG TPA: glycosyltransferase family 9 protein [Candidatus Acidoferrales bacterium]|nr:glycosyltransferase family 9 protein [Candidatus Acidoferrales bacterium]